MAGNRIELDGRLLTQPEVRVTPAGTPVLRFKIDCSVPGEEMMLTVIMTGDSALAAKALLEPGRPLRVVGRLRALRAGLKAVASESAFEVVAESVELADS